MISEETISEILDRASILDFPEELGSPRQQGRNHVTLCPFHQEKTPSFNIRDNGKLYYCFGCGASGNVISYLMKTRGLSFPEVVSLLADAYSITIKKTGNSRSSGGANNKRAKDLVKRINLLALDFFKHELRKSPPAVLEYLSSRGIFQETAKKFEIGYAPSEWRSLTDFLRNSKVPDNLILDSGLARKSAKGDLYDSLRGRIVFPIYSRDRVVVGYGGRTIPGDPQSDNDKSPKYINSPETIIYKKNQVLFGFPLAQTPARLSGELYILEGYFDVTAFHQFGVEEAVATCGTALTQQHVDLIKRLVKRVVIVFDGDTAGKDAAAKSYEHFLNSGLEVKAIFLPEGEDPDSFAQKHGEDLRSELNELSASPLFDCFVEYLSRKHGEENPSSLSPSHKAKVANELAKTLQRVENPIERDDLVKRGAFLMKAESSTLSKLLDLNDGNPKPTKNWTEQEESDEEQGRLRSPYELPHLQRLLLQSIMVLRDGALKPLLSSPEQYSVLSPSLSIFCESFKRALDNSEDDPEKQKKAVQHLLQSFGSDWVKVWKESYRMAKDPEVDFELMWSDCLQKLQEEKIIDQIGHLSDDIREEVDPNQRESLIQARLELERNLRKYRGQQGAQLG